MCSHCQRLTSSAYRICSVGSMVTLNGEGAVEYVHFVWRSAGSFDDYECAVPTIEGVEEVIVRSRTPGGALALSSGSTTVHLDLRMSPSGQMNRVWSSVLGGGSYSMDGLHVRFARQDVVGVKLEASPPSNPSFEAWDGAVFHFGRAVDSAR